jgi:hypothetical protein
LLAHAAEAAAAAIIPASIALRISSSLTLCYDSNTLSRVGSASGKMQAGTLAVRFRPEAGPTPVSTSMMLQWFWNRRNAATGTMPKSLDSRRGSGQNKSPREESHAPLCD